MGNIGFRHILIFTINHAVHVFSGLCRVEKILRKVGTKGELKSNIMKKLEVKKIAEKCHMPLYNQ